MKRILGSVVASLIILTACSKKQAPEEPVDKKELLVGTWASQRSYQQLTVNGKSGEVFDSITPGATFEFTENFNYYGSLDTNAIIGSIKMLELADTAKYNLHFDTLYLIKNAVAYDTLLVKTLDETNLEVIIDYFTQSIGGQLVSQETVVAFQRVAASKEDK
ncbi:MAG TPA: hypothetical protein DCG19_14090 [Cryomorphaceae bacterium]|nr:hypothetical protein [Owenweeksia sp.]MBG00192.1 hypothetical protein [Owenweeksia sp.]HAD98536.1 hypothetical protein [Cryomorphaceae bacterium]HBF21114.1 hypothetical protein [Cryomorphaceae bacterium]HCQ17371.1 hypothetical protein [Cryomorphaceae bacterium]|tara:strand:+ start:21 stop:506 length:486 start_codon:yes stop_codon:yes gene_type:complete